MRHGSARWLATGMMGMALSVLASATTISTSSAGTDVDLRMGVYPDADAFAFGGGLLTDIGHTSNWYFNPNLEIAMGDARNLMILSGDFHYDFGATSNLSIWAGGGPALLVDDPDRGDSSTDFGLNALMGLGARSGNVRPFGQIRGTIADQSQLALQGGIRF
jgi:hypothetical protein